MNWRAMAAAAMAALGIAANPAAAQNLILNPSFETGDTLPWTITGACPFDVLSPPSDTTGAGGFPAQNPAQGNFILQSDALAAGTCELFQDVALPALIPGQAYAVSVAAGYNYRNFFDPTAAGCDASIAVTTTGGVPIAGVFGASGSTSIPISYRGRTYLPDSVAGTTVRLIITTNSCVGGPAGIVADDFVLAAVAPEHRIPTLSQWATTLLALAMACIAMAALRRRNPLKSQR